MPQGERLRGNSRAGIGGALGVAGSWMSGSAGVALGAPAAGVAGAAAELGAAVAAGETGAAAIGEIGAAAAGAAGGATSCCAGAADWANPGIASTPKRHRAGAPSLNRNAIVRLTDRIIPVLAFVAAPDERRISRLQKYLRPALLLVHAVLALRQQTEIIAFVNVKREPANQFRAAHVVKADRSRRIRNRLVEAPL